MLKKNFLFFACMIFCFISNSAISFPLIGDKAPSFKTDSTQGEINFPKDYEDKWVVLFSHPADFTPVCTTEFIAFQEAVKKFNALNTKLIGLSEDDVKNHREWIESIANLEYTQKMKHITFPIIDDVNGNIAKKYGMLQKDKNKEKTVRAVFVIDPNSTIRAIIYYPQAIGRYIPEIERLLIALQTSDAFEVSTPANWMPGDDVILPSSKLPEGANSEDLKNLKIKRYAPYLHTQELSKEEIKEKLLNNNNN